MDSASPVFEYLVTCSEPAVESYELSRLNRAANLRKAVSQLIDEWIQCEVEAQLARWRRDARRKQFRIADVSLAGQEGALPQQLSLPFLPATITGKCLRAGSSAQISVASRALAHVDDSRTAPHNNRETVPPKPKRDGQHCGSPRHAAFRGRRQPAPMSRKQHHIYDAVADLSPLRPDACSAASKNSPRLHILRSGRHNSAQERVAYPCRHTHCELPLPCAHLASGSRVAAR